jgi:8-oxo-dGTP pyrophosphatase MutT (NUDIX family)
MTRDQQLLAQLRTYEPFDAAEEEHRRSMLALLSSASEPFSRGHFAPGHFTASCFIVDDSGRLLLHHHRRLQKWLQMGGHVEADETALAAALREGAEESGLGDLTLAGEGILDLDVHVIPAGRGEPEHRHFDVRYVLRTASPEALAIDREESLDVAWVSLDRAAELMAGEQSLRVLEKLESLLRERSLT